MDIARIVLKPEDIRAACEQPDMVFGYDGTRWGLMLPTESTLGRNVNPQLFTEIKAFNERYSITVAVVTVDEMEHVWNDRRVDVVFITRDNGIIKAFMEATPWGRRETTSRRMMSYNESWSTWTVSMMSTGDVLQMWGYD